MILTPDRCYNRGYRADYLEDIVWGKIKNLLSQPEIVLEGLRMRQEDVDNQEQLGKQLETIERQLSNQQKQRDRIHKAFYLTGNEEQFKRDFKELEKNIEMLQSQKAHLESRLASSLEFEAHKEEILAACQVVRDNLKILSFEEKRQALEALSIKVKIDGDEVLIEGIIPVIASLPS